ncbi:hypothetical protein OCU04_000444 [Sclerotinia nivalis]|uniref:Uncharacterized protein n=1 Tax=Sclerotinia nivalis TaxID=352851 RepID=A0A9X0AX53_9HELO|nr:hypothetical protein OCU04_000444 [Sclerotinia nivalis]
MEAYRSLFTTKSSKATWENSRLPHAVSSTAVARPTKLQGALTGFLAWIRLRAHYL